MSNSSRRFVRTMADLQKKGATINPDEMAQESQEAAARWSRDRPVLARWGQGNKQYATFDQHSLEHARLRAERPQEVAARKTVVRGRNEVIKRCKTWTEQTSRLLISDASGDQGQVEQILAALPKDKDQYDRSITTLSGLLAERKERFEAEAEVDQRLSESAELLALVRQLPGQVSVAKAGTVQDTASLDVCSAQLYFMIRDLNDTARKAIRAGELQASLSEYKFHHVGTQRTSKAASAKKAAAEKKAPTEKKSPTDVAGAEQKAPTDVAGAEQKASAAPVPAAEAPAGPAPAVEPPTPEEQKQPA